MYTCGMYCRFAIAATNLLSTAFLLATTAACAQSTTAFPLSENSGFCSGGAPAVAAFQTWGTYCSQGDATSGRAATQTFRLTGPFAIYLSGSPTSNDLSIQLENVTNHQSLDIRPNVDPGIAWLKFEFDIPDSWRGKELRIVAHDHSTGLVGWLAFSAPLPLDKNESLRDAKKIFLKTLLFVMLMFLPGFTLCAFAIFRGVRGTLKLGLIAMAGISIPGYVLFFLYVFSPKIAYASSATLPYVCAVLLLFFLLRVKPHERRRLLPFLVPLALTLFATLGILSFGYLYGGSDFPNMTARNRFSHPLPTDNALPYLFAEGLRKGAVPRPMTGDWLSSDRPPLQTGMVLALEPWMQTENQNQTHPRHELWYQVASVIMQSLWIFAIWLLMRAFRISPLTTALVIVTIYLSGFIIVNSFFVWPKLLAAAYLIAFALPILASRPLAGRGSWLLRILMGFLLACSLLSHGGTLFAVLGLMIYMLVHFRKQMLLQTCIIGLVTVLLYSPWIWYQKFVDPPGDRLVKYHLAGVEQITTEPALETIFNAYRKLTFSQWLSVKQANTQTVFGHELQYLRNVPDFMKPPSQAILRALEFFFFLPCLSFVALGILALPLRWKKCRIRNVMTAAERLILWAFLTTIPWILLLFVRDMTIVHVSAYAMELAAMAGSILALRAVASRLAIAVCLLQCAFQWVLYEPDLTHVAFPQSLHLVMNPWMMALHLFSLAGLFVVLALPVIIQNIRKRPRANVEPPASLSTRFKQPLSAHLPGTFMTHVFYNLVRM